MNDCFYTGKDGILKGQILKAQIELSPCLTRLQPSKIKILILHKKLSFPLKISPVNDQICSFLESFIFCAVLISFFWKAEAHFLCSDRKKLLIRLTAKLEDSKTSPKSYWSIELFNDTHKEKLILKFPLLVEILGTCVLQLFVSQVVTSKILTLTLPF